MPKYRHSLPQTAEDMFISDGGMETTLIFNHGLELPEFASFVLMQDEAGRQSLRRYYQEYGELARRHHVGFIVDTPTWRANRDWGAKLGFSEDALTKVNQQSIEFLVDLRPSIESEMTKVVVSGAIGPRADGYVPSLIMTVEEATAYHLTQIKAFEQTEADMVTAFTLNYVEEAIGIALAAQSCNMPVVISFTVETDGKLPTGTTLKDAIEQTEAATGNYPVYYMINCAHPLHFQQSLAPAGDWLLRLRGLRANASHRSHAELNEATELDAGNPDELANQYRALKEQFGQLTVLGGCCGTDLRHIEAICNSALAPSN